MAATKSKPRERASRHGAQIPREFLNGIQQDCGFGGAQAGGGGKRAQDADGADAGAASHFDVLSRVANVHALLGSAAETLQREPQWGGVRLLFGGVFTANTGGKIAGELELAELAANARTVSTGDNAEVKFSGEEPDDATRAREQRRIFELVGAGPQAVGFDPFGTRELRGTINTQPIGGVVLRKVALGPIDSQGVKHGEIGVEVGVVGVQERAVPIEEDCANGELCEFHGEGIVSDRGE